MTTARLFHDLNDGNVPLLPPAAENMDAPQASPRELITQDQGNCVAFAGFMGMIAGACAGALVSTTTTSATTSAAAGAAGCATATVVGMAVGGPLCACGAAACICCCSNARNNPAVRP